MEIYYEKLAHEILGPKKSHDLPSASWRSRKASGIIPFESKGLGPRAAGGVNPSPRAGEGEMKHPAQAANQEKRDKFLLFLPFALFIPSMGWMVPTRIEKGRILACVRQ